MGAAIFPERSKYGGGPGKMAMAAARQRWRRCSGNARTGSAEAKLVVQGHIISTNYVTRA